MQTMHLTNMYLRYIFKLIKSFIGNHVNSPITKSNRVCSVLFVICEFFFRKSLYINKINGGHSNDTTRYSKMV